MNSWEPLDQESQNLHESFIITEYSSFLKPWSNNDLKFYIEKLFVGLIYEYPHQVKIQVHTMPLRPRWDHHKDWKNHLVIMIYRIEKSLKT